MKSVDRYVHRHILKDLREDSNQILIQKQAQLSGPTLSKGPTMLVSYINNIKQRH